MKVIQLKLRTPGIFLGVPDPEQGIETPVLTLKIKQGEDTWVTVDQVDDIKVLADSDLPKECSTTEKLVTSSIEVPLQGEGTKTYNLLVPDGKEWEYRIEATPCIDCVKVYRTYNMDDQILNGIGVIVATGKFNSYGSN